MNDLDNLLNSHYWYNKYADACNPFVVERDPKHDDNPYLQSSKFKDRVFDLRVEFNLKLYSVAMVLNNQEAFDDIKKRLKIIFEATRPPEPILSAFNSNVLTPQMCDKLTRYVAKLDLSNMGYRFFKTLLEGGKFVRRPTTLWCKQQHTVPVLPADGDNKFFKLVRIRSVSTAIYKKVACRNPVAFFDMCGDDYRVYPSDRAVGGALTHCVLYILPDTPEHVEYNIAVLCKFRKFSSRGSLYYS